MKKIAKILLLSMLMVTLLSFVTMLNVFAAAPSPAFSPETISKDIKDKASTATVTGDVAIKNAGGAIVYGLKFVGFILGILLLSWFGIKWMTVGPQERAGLKDQAWNYVIGAVFLFGCGPLAGWIYSIVTEGLK